MLEIKVTIEATEIANAIHNLAAAMAAKGVVTPPAPAGTCTCCSRTYSDSGASGRSSRSPCAYIYGGANHGGRCNADGCGESE